MTHETNELLNDLDLPDPQSASGLKLTAWKSVMMGLRNYVRPLTALPPWHELLPQLQAVQRSYLLSDLHIRKYLFGEHVEAPGYGQIQAAICAFLVDWRAGKRKKLQSKITVADFQKAQLKILLTVDELKGNVWNWYKRGGEHG